MLQQKYSQEGPFISTGDMNGDGREDVFIGGAYKQWGRVFLQQADGSFTGKDLGTGTKNEEDMQSALFDADGDGDNDLLVVSGSSEFDPTSSFYRPRLYLNDGNGHFTQNENAFSPLIRTPGKCIAVADMDGDGDMDVFIGGRVSVGTFPKPVRSYVLRNDGGVFTDVTRTVCPALEEAGLMNAAVWTDMNGDKKPDLVIAADWSPIRMFINNGNTLTEATGNGLDSASGFWRSLLIKDIDGDGKPDIIAGNIGMNTPFHITGNQPAELVAKDFDGNGMVEPIFCYYIKGSDGKYVLSSGISRDEWVVQMPSLKKMFDQNVSYAKATMGEVFTPDMKNGAITLQVKEARSGYFKNDGKGGFVFHPFPVIAQIAPVNAMVYTDVTGDGTADIMIAGNEYQTSVGQGRYDASYGCMLQGDGKGGFIPLSPAKSGLVLDGDVKDLKWIKTDRASLLLAAINDNKMKAFAIKK